MSSSEARADWVRLGGLGGFNGGGAGGTGPVSTTAAEAGRPTSDAAVLHCQIASLSQGAVVAAPSVASAAQEGAQRVALAAPPPNVTAAGGGTQSAGGLGGVNSLNTANNGLPGASGTGGAGGPDVLSGSAGGGGGGGYFGGGGGAGGTLPGSGTGGGGSSFPSGCDAHARRPRWQRRGHHHLVGSGMTLPDGTFRFLSLCTQRPGSVAVVATTARPRWRPFHRSASSRSLRNSTAVEPLVLPRQGAI